MAKFGVIVFTAAPDGSSPAQGAYVKVDGREALLRCVELFLNRDAVGPIVVGVSPADAERAKEKFASHALIMGFATAAGGPGLRDQVRACAAKLPADVTHVILHDAARPAVSPLDLDRLLEAAEKHAAVALTTAVASSVVRIDESGTLGEPMAARSLRHLVWPQAYERATFDEWLAKGGDAILSRVEPVASSACNVRVNSADEAAYVKAMLALLPRPATRASTNPFDEAQW